jgi:peptide/nickel transport system substrate-binding protein
MPSTSRRALLKLLVATPGLALLAACAPSAPASPPTSAPAAKPTDPPKPSATAALPATSSSPAASPAASPVASPGAVTPSASPGASPVASPAAAAAPASSGASAGRALTVALSLPPQSLDPSLYVPFENNSIVAHFCEPLVSRDAQLKLQPHLAESYSRLNDTTWQFKLRPNVKFHNGEAFDANAVKFSIERVLANDKAPMRANISAIERVDVVDPLTANIVTKGPYPLLPASITGWGALIVPPVYAADPAGPMATKPVGTGPYKFVEWIKDDRVRMEAFEGYWRTPAAIKQVTFRTIPEAATRLAELTTGGVDLAVGIGPADMAGLDASPDTKSLQATSVQMMRIGPYPDKGGPLANVQVRQAMNYAVDWDAIVKSILGGLGKRETIILPPEAFGADPSIKPYPYDPAKAKQALADGGFGGGFNTSLTFRQGQYKGDEISQAVAGYLGAVGIKTEVKQVEAGVFAELQRSRGFELVLGTWGGNGMFDADQYFVPMFRTGQTNAACPDPDLDALIDRARVTLDPGPRADLYRQALTMAHDKALNIFGPQLVTLYGARKSLNWTARSDELVHAYEMSVG